MKVIAILALVVLATSFTQSFEHCLDSFKTVKTNFFETIQKQNINDVIDGLQTLSEEVPSILENCGAKGMAEKSKN